MLENKKSRTFWITDAPSFVLESVPNISLANAIIKYIAWSQTFQCVKYLNDPPNEDLVGTSLFKVSSTLFE